MNTYRKAGQILSICLLVVFSFVATQPVKAQLPYGSKHATYQSHLENLAMTVVPHWKAFNVKSPLLGPTWRTVDGSFISKSARESRALDVSLNEFSHFFDTSTTNAP